MCQKQEKKFKLDCFAGARNVRGITKINSDFGHPENTAPLVTDIAIMPNALV